MVYNFIKYIMITSFICLSFFAEYSTMMVLWYFIFGIVLPSKISSIDSASTPGFKRLVRQSEAFKIVEQAMLKSMGLKTRPRPRKEFQVPKYMIDLYNSDSEHPEWTSTRFRFANKWTSVNTVRAFHHKGKNIAMFFIVVVRETFTFPGHKSTLSSQRVK